jgi:predicted nuclease of restriction endonuclease-like (RecB) superfamily
MTSELKNKAEFDFGALVSIIRKTDEYLAARAGKAINISLTLRNWLIGRYIAEFELRGLDKATYGENLLEKLSEELRSQRVSNTGRRQLYNYLSFYRLYPQIARAVSAQCPQLVSMLLPKKVQTVSAQSSIDPEKLLNNLSYSHFELLIRFNDDLKRSFYEIQCIRSNWSVRELKRQINSLYYERSGLSRDKDKLEELTQVQADQNNPKLTIRDPYVFEFLGIKSQEIMRESDLEEALLDRLQDFLLELGHGFCFEARQKRILIGDSHGFVGLVFYHRILKCHVLVELKLETVTHENLGQLNTYVNWYRKNVMDHGDNPPIGLLLCTHKNQALVEYALAGIDNKLFISKYQLELPKKEEIKEFLEKRMLEVNNKAVETISAIEREQETSH